MIGFDLNEGQVGYQSLARTFAEKEMKPYAAALDKRQGTAFDWEIVRRFARANLLALAVPKEYGGLGSLKTLAELGFSPDDFAGFVQRLAGVANRHSIKPIALRNRLLCELEQLDAGMSLELLVKTGRQEVSEIEKSIAKKVEERTALEDTLKVLHQQKETIKSAMVEEQTNICEVFQATTTTAKEAVTEFTSKLQQGICESLQDVQKLREHTLEVGQEEGRLQGAIETNEWLRTLLALTKGDVKVQAIDVRAIATSVLRGMKSWMQQKPGMISALHQLTAKIDAIIEELERWKI